MATRVDEYKAGRKAPSETVDVVTLDWKATALFWSVCGKGGNDQVSTADDGFGCSIRIRDLVVSIRQKVKGCPIVPDVDFTVERETTNVATDISHRC
jgi:hypothetical protein